jgi:hypothetical protein
MNSLSRSLKTPIFANSCGVLESELEREAQLKNDLLVTRRLLVSVH